jgi:hypothetical protein
MTSPKTQGPITDKTVGDLLAALSKLDPSMPIVVSRDEEGNGFSPLADWSEGTYAPDVWGEGDLSTYSGELVDEEGSDEREEDEEEEEDEDAGERISVKVLVLWPEN